MYNEEFLYLYFGINVCTRVNNILLSLVDTPSALKLYPVQVCYLEEMVFPTLAYSNFSNNRLAYVASMSQNTSVFACSSFVTLI